MIGQAVEDLGRRQAEASELGAKITIGHSGHWWSPHPADTQHAASECNRDSRAMGCIVPTASPPSLRPSSTPFAALPWSLSIVLAAYLAANRQPSTGQIRPRFHCWRAAASSSDECYNEPDPPILGSRAVKRTSSGHCSSSC